MPERLVHFATNPIFDGQKAEFGSVTCAPYARLLAGKVTPTVQLDPTMEGRAGKPEGAKFNDPDTGLEAGCAPPLGAAQFYVALQRHGQPRCL